MTLSAHVAKVPACTSGKAVTTEMLPCLCEDPGVPRAAARPRPVTGREGTQLLQPCLWRGWETCLGRPRHLDLLALHRVWGRGSGAGEWEEDGEKTVSGTEVSGWVVFGSGPPSTFKSKYYQ